MSTVATPSAPAPLVPPIVNGTPAQTVSLRAAAQLLNRHERTVRRWITAGALPATRTPGGHISIRVADLNAFGTVTTETAVKSVPIRDDLSDVEWIEAFRAPRGTYSLVWSTAPEPHEVLIFWGELFDTKAEYIGVTVAGHRRWRVQPPTGQSIVIEQAAPPVGVSAEDRELWVPTATVDAEAPERLREWGFAVSDDRVIDPEGNRVDLVIADVGFGITGWNVAKAGA